jgi:hypothetical protein
MFNYLSMSCKNICTHIDFIETFAVRKQIGRLPDSIKKLFGYCSECAIYLISKPIIYCKCCSTKIRSTLRDGRNADSKQHRQWYQKWYSKNKEKHKQNVKEYKTQNKDKQLVWEKTYYQRNKERILQRQRERRTRKKQNG